MVVDVVDIIDNEIYRITPMLQHGDYYATKWVYFCVFLVLLLVLVAVRSIRRQMIK